MQLNENSKLTYAADTKCDKTCLSKSRLVLVLFLIGWWSGVSFLRQSFSINGKPKQMQIGLDREEKSALTE